MCGPIQPIFLILLLAVILPLVRALSESKRLALKMMGGPRLCNSVRSISSRMTLGGLVAYGISPL